MVVLNATTLRTIIVALLVVGARLSDCQDDNKISNVKHFFKCTLLRLCKDVIKRPDDANYKVLLSLDGGGFRGAIIVVVLIELEDTIKNYILQERPDLLPENVVAQTADDFDISLADFVDFMGGTSTGALVGSYIASKGGNGRAALLLKTKQIREKYGKIAPQSAKGMLVLLNEFGDEIFPQDVLPPNVFNPGTDPKTPGVIRPILESDAVQQVFGLVFGNMKLSEMSTSFAIAAYDLLGKSGVLFIHDQLVSSPRTGFSRNIRRNGPRSPEDGVTADFRGEYGLDFRIKDVLVGSIAIPVVLPAFELLPISRSEPKLLVADGLLFSNDPLLPLLIHTANSTGDTSFSSIAVMSVGTGVRLPDLTDNANGGSLQWDGSGDRLDVASSVAEATKNKQVEFLYFANPKTKPGQFLRIQLFAEANTPLNLVLAGTTNSQAVLSLTRIGEEVAATYGQAIAAFVKNFIFA